MSQEILDQVMEILRQRQGAVDQAGQGVQRAQRGLQRASSPVNTQFANPGQSFGRVMTDGTGAQRQAMIQMGAEMARDSSRVPGAAMASGFNSGFQLLDQIRRSQRKQGMQQAEAGVGAAQQQVKMAQDARQAQKGFMDTATQMKHAFGEQPEAKEREMKKGADGLYRYIDNGEPVFPDVAKAQQDAAAAEMAEKASASKSVMEGSLASIETELMRSIYVNDSLDTAEGDTNFWTTGLVGNVLKEVGGTGAADLEQVLDHIKANIGFDRLQQMRDDSKTGGALGQVSIRELDLLMSSMGSLAQAQSADQMRRHIRQIKKHYQRFLESAKTDYEKAGGDLGPIRQFEEEYRATDGAMGGAGPQTIRTPSGTYQVSVEE